MAPENMSQSAAVYILSSGKKGTLYVGVTSDLSQRIWQQRQDLVEGFTKKYDVHCLVYFEQHERMEDAILREKQIKKWNRAWKVRLIEATPIGGICILKSYELDSRLRGNDE